MVNIFHIPVYYISFKPNHSLETSLKNKGFNTVHHFRAIDGRKMDINELLENKIITIRSYNDLIQGREQHSGMPSLGAIGCTISHSSLWNLCVKKNMPYIIIVEDDLWLPEISQEHLEKIQNILEKPNSIYVGRNIYKQEEKLTSFIGLQFYIVSNGAARELVKKIYPIDVQTDAYIAHLDTIKKVNLGGFNLAEQKFHPSSIQEPICFKCNLATQYVLKIAWFIVPIIFLLILAFMLFFKLHKCKQNCPITTNHI